MKNLNDNVTDVVHSRKYFNPFNISRRFLAQHDIQRVPVEEHGSRCYYLRC